MSWFFGSFFTLQIDTFRFIKLLCAFENYFALNKATLRYFAFIYIFSGFLIIALAIRYACACVTLRLRLHYATLAFALRYASACGNEK